MHTFRRHQHRPSFGAATTATRGRIVNLGWRYDLAEWCLDTLFLRGALRGLRQRTADLARLQPGEMVLDVGCGTGTLALVAQQRVGLTGRVVGIDPGPQQIARARAKAAQRQLPIQFQMGVIEQLPFPYQMFDVVLSTLMLHHLPDDLKRQGLAEIARVLKPEGRLVIADFQRSEGRRDHRGQQDRDRQEQPTRLGAGASGMQELSALVQNAGFSRVETEEMRLPRFPAHPGRVGFVWAHKSERVVGMGFAPFLAAVKHQMQPEGRAEHQAAMLQQLLAGLPAAVTLADLVAGWQQLAQPQSPQEPASVKHRRGICAELAAIGSPLTRAAGNLAGAVQAWQIWQAVCQASVDPRLAVMAKTFARELVELQANP